MQSSQVVSLCYLSFLTQIYPLKFLKIHINIIIDICFSQLLSSSMYLPFKSGSTDEWQYLPFGGRPDFGPWTDICVSAEIMKELVCNVLVSLSLPLYLQREVMLKFAEYSSVTPVMSNCMWTHEPQHTRGPCPSH